MTRSEYKARALGYYAKRLQKLFARNSTFADAEGAVFFRVVQAGIMSIAPGRQSSKTRGWNADALQAHRRAAAALR